MCWSNPGSPTHEAREQSSASAAAAPRKENPNVAAQNGFSNSELQLRSTGRGAGFSVISVARGSALEATPRYLFWLYGCIYHGLRCWYHKPLRRVPDDTWGWSVLLTGQRVNGPPPEYGPWSEEFWRMIEAAGDAHKDRVLAAKEWLWALEHAGTRWLPVEEREELIATRWRTLATAKVKAVSIHNIEKRCRMVLRRHEEVEHAAERADAAYIAGVVAGEAQLQ